MKRTLAVVLSGGILLGAPAAHAQSCSGVVTSCIDADTFWPRGGPARFQGILAPETMPARAIGAALVTSFQSRPLVLETRSPGPGSTRRYAVDAQITSTFAFAYGFTSRFQIDAALPVTFWQTGGGVSPITGGPALAATVLRDVRVGATYAFLPRASAPTFPQGTERARTIAVAARSELSLPTGSAQHLAGDRGLVWSPSLAGDARMGRFTVAAELGLRVRGVAALAGLRMGTQAVAQVGIAADLLGGRPDLLGVTLEARVMPVLVEQRIAVAGPSGLGAVPGGKALVPGEWMLGVRTAAWLEGDLVLHASGGTGFGFLAGELPATAPRFRFVLGLRYAPTAHDADGDGVKDAEDRCPRTFGTPTHGPQDGCPEPPPAIPGVSTADGASNSTPRAVGGPP